MSEALTQLERRSVPGKPELLVESPAPGTRVLVVNCSHEEKPRRNFYNLGALKLADWLREQGCTVEVQNGDRGQLCTDGFDLVCLSVIFTWHAPTARQIALRVKGNSDVWAGGPGLFRLDKWWTEQTGLKAHHGLDQRFERQRGNYLMTFASRGCPGMGPVEQPKPCSFCIVWRLEGINFTLDWDFHPAPVLCDNNLSALPVDFQEHIIRRYQETETPLKDANSGFEPHTFDEGTYRRWKPILKGAWRFAFDTWEEAPALERMMTKVLKDEPARKKQVYVLAGNEEIQSCYERAQKVIEWGGEPYCQIVRPLDWLGGPHPMKFNWTEQLGRDFMRFYNSRAHIWRNTDLRDYRPRTNDAPPFKRILTVRREAA